MQITIKELYRKKKAMELKDVLCENDPLYMVYDFDPRETSYETWMGFYQEFKSFIPELTKKSYRQILKDHRTLYNRRAEIVWWKEQVHPMRTSCFKAEKFQHRIFPLSSSQYGNWIQNVIKHKSKKKGKGLKEVELKWDKNKLSLHIH